jgi:hypothetical protein
MMHKKYPYRVTVKHLSTEQVVKLLDWCSHNLAIYTWCWGGGEFQFVNESDAVQFALLLD